MAVQSFEEWQLATYGNVVSGAPQDPNALPPPPTEQNITPVSTFTPNAVPEGEYYAPAEALVQPQRAPVTFTPPSSMTQLPPDRMPLVNRMVTEEIGGAPLPTSYAPGSETQRALQTPPQDAYLRQLEVEKEANRLLQTAATQPGFDPNNRSADVQRRLQAEQAVDARNRDSATGWQEKLIPEVVRNSPAAGLVGALGAGAETTMDLLGNVPLLDAIGGGIASGAGTYLDVISAPQKSAQEAQITRKYDEIQRGNPDLTFGPLDPATIAGTTVINPIRQVTEDVTGAGAEQPRVQALQNWLEDPTNRDIIVGLYENGYQGETGYAAVYKYYNELQGLGGVAADVTGDPLLPAEVGLALATGGVSAAAAGTGALGRAARIAKPVLQTADLLFDPLKAPGRAVNAFDTVAMRRAMRRAGLDPMTNVGPLQTRIDAGKLKVQDKLLTASGRAQRDLDATEGAAAQMAETLTTVKGQAEPPLPFVRTSTGAIDEVWVGTPMGIDRRPTFVDPATGTARPVRTKAEAVAATGDPNAKGDIEIAMEVAARLPHEREIRTLIDPVTKKRIPGAQTTLEKHMADWIGTLGTYRGLWGEIDTVYPKKGAPYKIYTDYKAQRIRIGGQSVVDGMVQDAWNTYKAGKKKLDGELKKAKPNPVIVRSAKFQIAEAASKLDSTEAAISVAGYVDRKAGIKARTDIMERIRKDAAATGKYRRGRYYTAFREAGAPAPGSVPVGRTTYRDIRASIYDNDLLTFGDRQLANGMTMGDTVATIHHDLTRLRELGQQFVELGRLGKWDRQELTDLLTRYKRLFPDQSSIDTMLRTLNDLDDRTLTGMVANEARQQIGVDQKWLDPQGKAIRGGLSGANVPLLSKMARAFTTATSKYSKLQLYNPLNILRFSGLQFAGNATMTMLRDFGALPDYFKAVGSRGRYMGRQGAKTPLDEFLLDAGIGRSPKIKAGFKDVLDDAGDDRILPGEGWINSLRKFAGSFDIAHREALYMHHMLPRMRALQAHMRTSAIRRAKTMAPNVTESQIDNAFNQLDALHPRFRTYSPQEMRQALIDATGTPHNKAAQDWADRVARDYANGQKMLNKGALDNVDRVAFSFYETKVDATVGKLFMYFYWSSRANISLTREMLGNPALLNSYVSMWKTLDREAEKDGSPAYLRLFYQFMQSPAGFTVFLNPTALLNTFALFNPEILQPDWENPNLTDLGKARQRSPFMVNPIIDQLLLSAGVYGSGAQSVSLLPISTARIYDIVNKWHIENGNQPLNIGLRNLGKIPSEQMAEVLSSKMAPFLEQNGMAADQMQYGDLAASQHQDIVFQMRAILEEQNPGADQTAIDDLLIEHGGGFDTEDPIQQQALDRYAERAYAGILEGHPEIPDAVRALASFASPLPIQPMVTERMENAEEIDAYYSAMDDVQTFNEIVNGEISEPIRVGGYDVPPPSMPFEIPLEGTVFTPEDFDAMSAEERLAVASEWWRIRNPGYDPGTIEADGTFPEDAMRAAAIAKAANPQDLALQEAADKYYNPGTDEQNRTAQIAKEIRYGEFETIADVTVMADTNGDGLMEPITFTQDDLHNMREDERTKLMYLWLDQSENSDDYEAYWAAREQIITDHPDVGGQKAMEDLAAGYPGGAVAWVEEAIKENPNTYGQFAERLDPVRYPAGSEDWATKMLSLEAYQALNQERPASTAPYAWEQEPGPPVIPGLIGATSLPQLYQVQQQAAEAERDEYVNTYVNDVKSDLARVDTIMTVADEWDASVGNPQGTSRGKILDQMVNGYSDANKLDYDLYTKLKEEYSVTDEESGKTYGPIPSSKSGAGQYSKWVLSQPAGSNVSIDAWNAQSALVYELKQSATEGLALDDQGNVVLASEVESAETSGEVPAFLQGLSLSAAPDGSGQFIQQGGSAAAPPSYTVGPMAGTMYAEASKVSEPLILLQPNTPLTTIEVQGDWALVQEPAGLQGWMSLGYLKKAQGGAVTPAEAEVPVTALSPKGTALPAQTTSSRATPSQSAPAAPPLATPSPTPASRAKPATTDEKLKAVFTEAEEASKTTTEPIVTRTLPEGAILQLPDEQGVTYIMRGSVPIGVWDNSASPEGDYVIWEGMDPEDAVVVQRDALTRLGVAPSSYKTSVPTESAPLVPGERPYDPQVISQIDTTSYVSPNRTERGGAVPKGIVYHYTVGDVPSFTADFMGQTGRQASSNYVVTREGEILQFVDPDDSAWANGDVSNPRSDRADINAILGEMSQYGDWRGNLNAHTISIEIENAGDFFDPTFEPYTDAQVAALRELTAYLVDRYPTVTSLFGHEDVTDFKSDPGPLFPWAQMYEAAGLPPP